LLLDTIISFVNKAYGIPDVDIATLQKQMYAMQETLTKRMGAMEETIKKQQEMIDALKEQNRKVVEITTPNYKDNIEIANSDFKEVVGREIDNYFTKEDTKEKMVKAGLAPKLDFGYKEGFYFKTLDNKFSAKINNRLQYKYQYTDRDIGTDGIPDEDESTFDFRRIRTKISGNAYDENIKYRLEWDSSWDVTLLDAYVDFTHIPWANIWAGQGKVFSRQVLTSSASLQMIDRADTISEFRFQGDERKRGVAVHSDKILDGKFDYSIGVYNPQARTTDNNINTMLYLARTSYYPFGPYESYKESDLEYTETFKAHIGGGIGFEQIGQNESDSDEDEVDQTQLLAEFGFKYKGLSLAGEYHYRKRKVLDPLETADLGTAVSAKESLHDQGFFVQGGYFIIPKKLEIAGRYELIDYDSQNPSFGTSGLLDNICSYTAGLNYFLHGRDHKIQINYKHWDVGLNGAYLGDGNENFFLTQYQICF
jgi:regulator of replication initiation timing